MLGRFLASSSVFLMISQATLAAAPDAKPRVPAQVAATWDAFKQKEADAFKCGMSPVLKVEGKQAVRPLVFWRTDLTDPDGELSVAGAEGVNCKMNLSLASGVYFSPKFGALLIESHSGSTTQLEVFHPQKSCLASKLYAISAESSTDPGAAQLKEYDQWVNSALVKNCGR